MPTETGPGQAGDANQHSDVHYLDRLGRRFGLRELRIESRPVPSGRGGRMLAVQGREDAGRISSLVTATARSTFEMESVGLGQAFGPRAARLKAPVKSMPTVFEDVRDGRIRVVYKEVVVRFRKKIPRARQDSLLAKFGFKVLRRNAYVPDQVIATQAEVRHAGSALVGVSNEIFACDEVEFSTPNFVSEYARERLPAPRPAQWHLRHARVLDGWKVTRGKAGVVVAVLDDGVDLQHPNLKNRLKRNPDPGNPLDKSGRDFFVPTTQADHYDPSPKCFRYPYDKMDGNDIHGTPCAGVVAANGVNGVYGAAPGCRILPVKIFHGDDLASDAQVADAIRYAAKCASVLSCSWGGPITPDLQYALQDAQAARDGRGAIVLAASGNEQAHSVNYPGSDPHVIAVGAINEQHQRSWYSNTGRELWIVAPSDNATEGQRGIFTTDVSIPNRGFNPGTVAAGGKDGLYTNDFGGTSSATPLAAGIVALMLSKNPRLTAAQVRQVLQESADKSVGAGTYDAKGHSNQYGYGCIDAKAALAHPLVRGT